MHDASNEKTHLNKPTLAGGSVELAIREVEKPGAKVVAVSCIVDRLEGARERLAAKYEYRPIFTIRDFGVE